MCIEVALCPLNAAGTEKWGFVSPRSDLSFISMCSRKGFNRNLQNLVPEQQFEVMRFSFNLHQDSLHRI